MSAVAAARWAAAPGGPGVVGSSAVGTAGGSVAVPVGAPAPLALRVAAVVVDQAVVGVLATVLLLVTTVGAAVLGSVASALLGGRALLAVTVAGFVVAALAVMAVPAVHQLLHGTWRGQTWGKHVVGIAVVDAATGRPGIGAGRAFVRWLALLLSSAAFGLGHLAALWDPQGRTWHDRLTATAVVRCPPAASGSPIAFVRTLRAAQPPAPESG